MRTFLEVADVFRRHGAAYRQAHDGHIGRVERKVIGPYAEFGIGPTMPMSMAVGIRAYSAARAFLVSAEGCPDSP
jgi:hypothetical protein